MFKSLRINSTVILLIILIILAGGYFGWQYLKSQAAVKEEPLLFKNINIQQITKLEINQPQTATPTTTALELKDTQWLVASENFQPADTGLINDVLKTLGETRIKSLISTNPQKQANYGVEANTLRIKVFQGDKLLADFYAGKYGPIVDTGYFRWEGNDQVYLISHNLQLLFSVNDWVKKVEQTENK